MPEEFEFREMRGASFWGVDLQGATFRDVDLTGVTISHARVVDVSIDAFVERLTVNGVDVTDFVNQHDVWSPLRTMLLPPDPAGMRATWDALEAAWAPVIVRGGALPPEQQHRSVDGEWSFVETLRHLVFAMDKWCTVPLLGGTFAPMGLPNTGSRDFGWPGLDLDLDPPLADVLEVRAERSARFRDHLAGLEPDDLRAEVEVLENGPSPVEECIHVVFEEEFQHLRYATRDLDHLEA